MGRIQWTSLLCGLLESSYVLLISLAQPEETRVRERSLGSRAMELLWECQVSPVYHLEAISWKKGLDWPGMKGGVSLSISLI